jgi:cyclic pyranopterin phosphate synthase
LATPCTDFSHRTVGSDKAIDYLRVSVTDRCNLRCVYCMPAEGVPPKSHDDVLRYEEIARLVRVAAGLGISRVRLTGGEPLVRRGIADLVAMIATIPGIDDLSMTTNGTLLARHAAELARAGLRRVNVSLDTLDPARFRALTRLGNLEDALAGIRAAAEAGLTPTKINVVIMRGGNADEAAAFARRTVTDGWNVRFIEIMPIGEGAHASAAQYVPSAEIRAAIEAELGPLEPAELPGNGPARYWRVPGAPSAIGFISPISQHFCGACNRLRLGADGKLLPCLFTPPEAEIDLRSPLHGGAGDAELADLFRRAMAAKPDGHHLDQRAVPTCRLMSRVGG